MSRESFLKRLEEADNFYIAIPWTEEFLKTEVEKNDFSTYKEYLLSEHGDSHTSNIDIALIKNLTIYNQPETNPFMVFYVCDEEQIKRLVDIMAKTHKALRYFKLYSKHYREANKSSDKGKSANALKKAIRVIKEIDKDACLSDDDLRERKKAGYSHNPIGVQVVEYLQYLVNSLSNNHYTERRLFQDLLYNMNNLLYSINQNIEKTKVVEIVNTMIEKYYGETKIHFTTKTNLNNFKSYKYIYETAAGISLTHGKK